MTFISIINYQLLLLQALPLDMIILDSSFCFTSLQPSSLDPIISPILEVYQPHFYDYHLPSKLHVQTILNFISLPLQQQVACIIQNISPYLLFPIDLIPLQSDHLVSTLFATFKIPASHMWNVHAATLQALTL